MEKPGTETPPTPPPAPPAPPANDAWDPGKLTAEQRGFLDSNGYKTLSDTITGAVRTASFVGVDKNQVVRKPKDANDAEGMKAYRTAIGVPEKPEDYKLPVPEGGDPKYMRALEAAMHKAGVPAESAAAVAAFHNEFVKNELDAHLNGESDAEKAEEATLRQKFKQEGKSWDHEHLLAKQAAGTFARNDDGSVDTEFLTEMEGKKGYSKMLRFLAAVGRGMSEDISRNGGGGANSQDAATFELAQLNKLPDTLHRLKTDGEFKRRYEALQKKSAGLT